MSKNNIQPAKIHPSWVHFVGIILIFVFISVYFFHGKFLSHAWNHEADADVIFSAQTVMFMNDGDYYFLHHPGATIYAIQVPIHRLLSFVSLSHQRLFHLETFTTRDASILPLATAIKTGRIISLLVLFALAAAFYLLLIRSTRQGLTAFLFTAYLAVSTGFLRHAGVIRAESLSLLFYTLAVLSFVLASSQRRLVFILTALWITGFAIGLSILSKIQIALPAAFLLVAALAGIWLFRSPRAFTPVGRTLVGINLGVALVNLLIFPYWCLSKPSYLTTDVFKRLPEVHQVVFGKFGLLSVNFNPYVILLLVSLLAASGYFWLKLRRSGNVRHDQFFTALLMINLFIAGGIFSIYLIWLPASLSIESYINNTHILVYSTLTNLISGGGGFLTNDKWTLSGAMQQILDLNEYGSSFLRINILYLVIASSALCLLRMILPGTDLKRNYLITLLAFLIGFAMDFTSTFRLTYAYSIYALYSGIFYIFGLAYFCSLELRKLSLKPSLQLSWGGAAIFMIGCLFVAWRGDQILRNSKPILQESNYTEEEAWAMVDLYVPQYAMTVQFGDENLRSCLNAQRESFGMLNLAQIADPPKKILDMNVSTIPSYRWLNTGSIAVPEIDPLTEYPVFSPSNGGFTVSDERISQIFSQENAAGSFTVSAWVRPLQEPGYQSSGGETLLFGYPNGIPALTLYMLDRKSQYRFYYGDTGVIAQPSHFSTRVWDQIVLTKTPQEIRIYLNGDLQAARPVNGSYSQTDELPGINLWNNTGSASFEIASIAFWQQALDESVINNLFRHQLGVFSRLSPVKSEDNASCFAADDLVGYFISRGESRR